MKVDNSVSPLLVQKMTQENRREQEYERPTSGKHFERQNDGAGGTSQLVEEFGKGKRVDKLLKQLAKYMKQGQFEDGSPDPYD
jgi:hypothetical protein